VSKAALNDAIRPDALLVEDDPVNRLLVRLHLEEMGLNVKDVATFAEAKEVFSNSHFSLVLLHIGVEPLKGLELCRVFRSQSNVPIIAMTDRESIINEQMWIAAGADDYVARPVDINILSSRVSQQLKRGNSHQTPASDVLQWGQLKMDLTMHEFFVDGKPVALTKTEFQIVQLLLEKPLQVFSREQILSSIGSLRGPIAPNVIDTHASRIRTKIRKVGGPEVIRVVRSVGFRLAPDVTQ
jgi:DNA-binding response OmpR family regulator